MLQPVGPRHPARSGSPALPPTKRIHLTGRSRSALPCCACQPSCPAPPQLAQLASNSKTLLQPPFCFGCRVFGMQWPSARSLSTASTSQQASQASSKSMHPEISDNTTWSFAITFLTSVDLTHMHSYSISCFRRSTSHVISWNFLGYNAFPFCLAPRSKSMSAAGLRHHGARGIARTPRRTLSH